MLSALNIDSEDLPAWPPCDPAIRESVERVLVSGEWGECGGEVHQMLASQLAVNFQREYCLLCASGSAGIELALEAGNFEKGQEVIVAGYDYPGIIRAVEGIGANPVVVDVEEDRWVPTVSQLEEACSPRTAGFVVSHLYGNFLDGQAMREFSDRKGITFIEDACQGHGGISCERPAGGWGHLSVLSFGKSKLITGGSGGAVLCDDQRFMQRLRLAAEKPGVIAPLSSLQAAAILPQVMRLTETTLKRFEAFRFLQDRLSSSVIWRLPEQAQCETLPAFYKIAWQMPAGVDVARLARTCQERGLPCGAGFIGFTKRAKRKHRVVGELSNSEHCSRSTIVMDHRVFLGSDSLLERVAEILLQIEIDSKGN